MFVRTENFRSFLRLYPVVSIITAVNLILWLYIAIFPFGNAYLYQFIGYNAAIAQGEYWRLVSPIFLHGSFSHLLFNSFSFILFGPALERILGKVKFIIAYLAAGIIGNVATFFLSPPHLYYLGASGAIFGLFGIYLFMVLYRKELIDSANSQIILVILAISLVMTFIQPNINMAGHLFGFLGGLLAAPLVLPRRRSNVHSHEMSFNPNRWKKHKQYHFRKIHIVWLILILLALFGLFTRGI